MKWTDAQYGRGATLHISPFLAVHVAERVGDGILHVKCGSMKLKKSFTIQKDAKEAAEMWAFKILHEINESYVKGIEEGE